MLDTPWVVGDRFSSNELLARYLVADGRAEDRTAAKAGIGEMDEAETATYLRSLTPEQLLAPFGREGFGGMYPAVELIRDGAVLPSEPAVEAFRLGRYNEVPAILGTNRDEARLFMLFSSPFVARAFGLPLWLKDKDLYQATADYPSKMWKVRGADAPASAMRAIQGPSVYAYRFDWDEQPKFMMLDLSAALGAAHALEIPFVFGWLSLGPGTRFVFDPDKAGENGWLSNQMMSYWANFAYTGTPGRGRSGDQAEWKAWSNEEGGETFLVLDSPGGGGVRMSKQAGLTRQAVIASVSGDERLDGRLDLRCELYRRFVSWRGEMSESDYASVEDGACGRDFPLTDDPASG